MVALSSRTTLAELAGIGPHMFEVLDACHVRREGDDPEVTLGELCWARGFNTGMLLTLLQTASAKDEAARRPPPVDPQPFRAMPLPALVQHIEQVHHVYLRAELPRLTALAGAAATTAGEDGGRLALLRDTVQDLAAELEVHLQHEEDSLFAMVRDLAARGAITPTRCGDSIGGPVACMENDHQRAADALVKISELTNGHRAPGEASEAYRSLVAGLVRLDEDLRQHMYKENEVLFPRAIVAQREAAAARAG